jgi:predicted lipoprotein
MKMLPAGINLPLVALVVLAGMTPAPSAAQDEGQTISPDLGARVASTYIRPAVEEFSASTTELAAAMEALCATPGMPALYEARDGFAETVAAWGRLSILRFGPLVAENRFERVFFWPDPRGVTLRQVQELLAEEDANALTVEGLEEKSVALQGLPALEFVLHGGGADTLARETAIAAATARRSPAILPPSPKALRSIGRRERISRRASRGPHPTAIPTAHRAKWQAR